MHYVNFQTQLYFVHPRHRGFRVPNHYSMETHPNLKADGAVEEVTIHNARLLDPAPTVDTHGFELIHAPCDLDLLDNELVQDKYYEHCREVLKSARGCYDVRGGGHEYRNGMGGETGERGVKPTPNGSGGAYAGGIHSDMCAVVEQYFARLVPENRHFESLNLWRSCKKNELVQTMPLVVCDMTTVAPEDIVFGDGMATGNIRQYMKVVDQRIVYSHAQKWYYFPDMTEDEVLIFRQYDTRQEPLNLRTVFHTAARNPHTPPDAPMRYTIEVRMQAIYDVEENKDERVSRYMSQISDTYEDGSKCDWWRGPIENYVPPPEYRD